MQFYKGTLIQGQLRDLNKFLYKKCWANFVIYIYLVKLPPDECQEAMIWTKMDNDICRIVFC